MSILEGYIESTVILNELFGLGKKKKGNAIHLEKSEIESIMQIIKSTISKYPKIRKGTTIHSVADIYNEHKNQSASNYVTVADFDIHNSGYKLNEYEKPSDDFYDDMKGFTDSVEEKISASDISASFTEDGSANDTYFMISSTKKE